MNKYLYLSIILFSLSACTKEGVQMYDANARYLYIPNEDGVNQLTFTFKHHSDDVRSYDLFFDVKLAGLVLEEDKTYGVEVVEDETTADVADYTVDKQQIFHAGKFSDQLKVTVNKTAHLDTEVVNLTVRLVPNETFGLAEYLGEKMNEKAITATVTFSNKMSKPDWWDDDIIQNYLGEWSEFKYQRFIDSCDGEVLDLSEMSADEKSVLALKFKDDIRIYDWRDPDTNELLEVPIFG